MADCALASDSLASTTYSLRPFGPLRSQRLDQNPRNKGASYARKMESVSVDRCCDFDGDGELQLSCVRAAGDNDPYSRLRLTRNYATRLDEHDGQRHHNPSGRPGGHSHIQP